MAKLMKLTYLLRDLRLISCQRQNLNFINKLCLCHHTLAEGGRNRVTALNCWNNQIGFLKTSSVYLTQNPKIYTTTHNYFDEKKATSNEKDSEEPPKKLSIFQRFKAMYRDYWYVLVPVHVVTSAFWFGGFYYAARSGIDIVAFVEKLHLSESIVEKIKSSGHSTAGYIAISYALYKIFTPLRYTVTLGGTTISINYLKKWGYIKPMPKKEELKKMISDKRDSLRERRIAFKDNMIEKLNEKKS